jgi:hypothetical protein
LNFINFLKEINDLSKYLDSGTAIAYTYGSSINRGFSCR